MSHPIAPPKGPIPPLPVGPPNIAVRLGIRVPETARERGGARGSSAADPRPGSAGMDRPPLPIPPANIEVRTGVKLPPRP
ncbi:MAG: hypothetical protein JWM27_693 [Gemmatimonadetes bacterium]|nr:hypothetical protein [Gemmatimonadota bacterium]